MAADEDCSYEGLLTRTQNSNVKSGHTRPLSGALQQLWAFRFFDPGPGESGGPREVPLGYPWAFLGPPGASQRPLGPTTNQSNKTRNLNKLTEQWNRLWPQSQRGFTKFRSKIGRALGSANNLRGGRRK